MQEVYMFYTALMLSRMCIQQISAGDDDGDYSYAVDVAVVIFAAAADDDDNVNDT